MRLSTKIAGWLIFANMALMTAPGMIVVGLGSWPLQPWLPPMASDGGFNASLAAGFLWPIGIPLVIRVLDRWKHRWHTDAYAAMVVVALYLWAVLVSLFTLFQFAQWVPMPSVAGDQLQLDRSSDLKGPDTDNNGIRDDIDAWIAAQPITEVQRKATRQIAKVQQAKLLVDLSDQTALQVLGEKTAAAVVCMSDSFAPDRQTGRDLGNQIEAITANTKERAKQYIAYNRARSGSSGKLPSGNTCEP